jgi:hypothetical protein
MAKARAGLSRARVSNKRRISTVDQAIEAMGGDDRVAKWLGTHKWEIDEMRQHGYVERGCFAHFYITLTARGYTPMPKLFGLRSWCQVTMPGARIL